MYSTSRDQSLSNIWDKVKEIIRTNLEKENKTFIYNEFFNETNLVDLNEKEAIVTSKYEINSLVLNDNENLSLINSAFRQVLNENIRCRVVLESLYAEKISSPITIKDLDDNVMPEYTFDNFVVGPSNRESYAACVAVAMNPGRNTYNPLFIYGDSGLGKTHLISAVGNYIKTNYPEKKILYISSNAFVNQVVLAIKENSIDLFKHQLNSLDVLIMDDIQFLSGKEKTNEVFFDVYNELYNNRKQIILSSDRPPGMIKDIEERLISRFFQGLSVTITTPEFETAYKILKLKIKTHGIDENSIDQDVISFLATNFASDVRNLEGSLNRLLFYSINFAKGDRIDLKLAMEAFKGHLNENRLSSKRELTVRDVVTSVADYYGLTKQQLLGKTRTKNVANARHIAMFLCRKHLDVSFLKIGEEFGGRDHTTVLSACEKIDKLLKTNETYRKVINEIEKNMIG